MSGAFSDAVNGLFASDDQAQLPRVDEDLDTVLELIRNERRRLVIQIVADEGDSGILRSDLSKRIAAIEENCEEPPQAAYKRVYVGLYQTHLPKLTGYGLVKFNKESERVFPTHRTTALADLLNELERATGGEAE